MSAAIFVETMIVAGTAGLNYGDCFSYALAKGLDEALLFKGDDFRKTDVKAVLRKLSEESRRMSRR